MRHADVTEELRAFDRFELCVSLCTAETLAFVPTKGTVFIDTNCSMLRYMPAICGENTVSVLNNQLLRRRSYL